MNSTSFGSRNSGSRPACNPPAGTAALPPGNTHEEGAEARRVKNFTGQRKFQAPAADDFIKGMLPQGQLPSTQASVPSPLCSVLGAMVGAIKRLWQAAKPGAPQARKAD